MAVRHALDFSTSLDGYRDYIRASRGEFTVAKDQNVRLRTGWFSDRSATYLASGRPVVTQDTGFGDVLPTGEALFAVFDRRRGRRRRSRRSRPTTRARAGRRSSSRASASTLIVVLGRLLDDVGVRIPGRSRGVPASALPATVDLVPVSRRPTVLAG